VHKKKGGGVWVVEWIEQDEVGERIGRLRMVVSMEKRYEIMEKYLKARYCKVSEDCVGLRGLSNVHPNLFLALARLGPSSFLVSLKFNLNQEFLLRITSVLYRIMPHRIASIRKRKGLVIIYTGSKVPNHH
jgi:hypothetical protein